MLNENILYKRHGISVKEYDLRLSNGVKRDKLYLEFSQASVVIVCINEKGQFLLIQQERFGHPGLNWEFPSGGIEPNETPEEAAHRELLEETGTKATLTSIGMFYAFTGFVNLKAYAFLATNLDHNIANQQLENYEQITVTFMDQQQLFEKIASSEINDTYLMSSLMKYLTYKKLKKNNYSSPLSK